MQLAFIWRPRCVAAAVALAGAHQAAAQDEQVAHALELDDCIASLPECLTVLQAANHSGGQDEEDLAFSLLGSWLKALYTRREAPRLAEDRELRSSVLARLRGLAALSLGAGAPRPSLAMALGQMLFLYFWWGVSSALGEGLSGPDVEVVALAAELHFAGLVFAGCDSASTAATVFEAKKCPFRWRFVLMLLVELGRQLAVGAHDVVAAVAPLRLAETQLVSMRALPFFQGRQNLRPGDGPYRVNQNDDYLPRARHRPVWPREMWPDFAHHLEAHAHIFLGELLQIVEADQEYDEVFRIVQEQLTEFTPLPRHWGLLDLVRHGNATAACQYAPQSCALLRSRPEVDGRCFSERVPNAGVAFARLQPGTEIKPHFATEPRLAVHLGLVTPPGPEMWVAEERVDWAPGRALVFDDTYFHSVRHRGSEARFVLLAWTCHPCDLEWRRGNGEGWLRENPLPGHCGAA